MSDAIIFTIGAVVFVATSAASLLVGYLRFSELQKEDAEAADVPVNS